MIYIEDLLGKKGALCEGSTFMATDKLKTRYMYRYEGIEETQNGYNIHLHNHSNNAEIYVEKEWFRQRKIRIL